MIRFDKVSKLYNGGRPALSDITLGIEPGEFVSIVGHSGAGKTTLLKLLFAEEFPTEGTVYFGSNSISDLLPRELMNVRRQMGTVFQDFRLLPTKNVYENIAFAMEAAGKSDDEIKADVPYVLELVDIGPCRQDVEFPQRTFRWRTTTCRDCASDREPAGCAYCR